MTAIDKETAARLIADVTFEAVNSEMDRVLAGRVNTALLALSASVEVDADLLLDAYQALLVLHRLLDKIGLHAGVKTANDLADRIVAAHPEFPRRAALATPAPDAVQAGDLMARFSDAMVAESQPPSDEVREAARLIAEVADIAHCGGLRGMSESDALIAIRRTTLPFFKRAITPKVEP